MAYHNTQEIIWIERVFSVFSFAIVIWSIWAISQYAPQYYQEQNAIKAKLAENYGVSEDVVASLQCYRGYLHYPNSGVFSGLIAISPSKPCDLEIFEQQHHNPHSFEYFISVLAGLISVLFLFVFRSTKEIYSSQGSNSLMMHLIKWLKRFD
ncbi:hypothetical protein [Thiomicrorhabdus sediminis]|uniref:Uncharacterized protein n=1 Tax=Thiomicrorhabdus sediminis TaxID=2580412 RepID=A0A4P9K963_9GAMM|nr:hypothetical protein [Thiomicrorhabdus sediminis]QCU91000.1 hypothetical protein FE785_10375 [Thiomicrorhabdus sediminis]